MTSHVFLEGWPSDDADAEAHDLVCRVCGGTSRLNPRDKFVEQVRIFVAQHRHVDERRGAPES